MPPYTPPVTPSPNKHVVRNRLLIAGSILIIIGIGLHLYRSFNGPTCFTASDYSDLYRSAPGDVVFGPGATFFTHSYSFTPATAVIDTSDPTISAAEDSTKIAAFYKKHTNKAMVFTIEAAYLPGGNTDESIAKKRTELLKKLLTDAGIPAELISVKAYAYDIDEDDINAYDDIDNATITLSSTETCHE